MEFIDICKNYSLKQLSYRKVNREVVSGDICIICVREEPTCSNNYVSSYRSYVCLVTDIKVDKDYPTLTKYKFLVYDRNGYTFKTQIELYQMRSIYPVNVTDDDFQKVKAKNEKQAEHLKKVMAAEEEQRRRDAEEMRIFQENIRKQEEADRLAAVKAEEDRRNEPMVITVGMWEDLMTRIAKLEESSSNSELEFQIECLRRRVYGPGLEE